MPSELDLLRSLDDEPRTPSTVDISRAIAAGRRRRVRRGVGYAGAATVTALAVAGASVAGGVFGHAPAQTAATGAPQTTAAAPPRADRLIPGTAGWSAPAVSPPTSCTLDRLPLPDDAPMAVVSGADPTGRYLVGRSYPRSGGYQAVIWQDGGVRKVTLPGDREELLHDVNSTGTAVGWSYPDGEADAGPLPYVYRDGKVSKLPGVRSGSAYAINDAGAIVGDDDTGHAALVWPSATAAPVRLPVPAGASESTARDIDEDGTTVGTIDNQRPYVWFPDGTHRELPMPTLNGERATTARVFGIRNGWATGVAGDGLRRPGSDPKAAPGAGPVGPDGRESEGRTTAVRWNVRTGEVRVSDELRYGADAVNAQGWQVGTDKQGRAVLVTDTATVVLPELVARTPDGLSTIATTLSDDGRTVAGQSDDATDTIQAVVWRCR
ncbi:hypothetical protein GCM10022225_09320 [Plantactinospora mayteni]|uniref:HAF repeat-containing protein n=1 Tax=Plantactinospora mayteni TaxID=566021 RepID=A0ABQ4EJA7_9ACTN|nr:hypothetical protein [Plantactinospora mayteni]GIG94321.1 hypothetical protein Pma05_08940 [Plantactinospora mayteni]